MAPGRPKGAASTGSRAQRPSPSPRHPRPPAAGPRNSDPAALPAAPRPLRPVSPAAPGHAAPRAGAGSEPVRPPAPLPLGAQLIGQAGHHATPDWCRRCLSLGREAAPRGLSSRRRLLHGEQPPDSPASAYLRPLQTLQAAAALRARRARWAPAASEAARPHAPGSLSRRRALGGAHAQAGGGAPCGPAPGWGRGAQAQGRLAGLPAGGLVPRLLHLQRLEQELFPLGIPHWAGSSRTQPPFPHLPPAVAGPVSCHPAGTR